MLLSSSEGSRGVADDGVKSRSEKTEVTVLLVLVQVEGGVKPLAHNESLLDLEVNFFRAEGLQKDEGDKHAEGSPVHPDWHNAGAHGICEVALPYVKQVGGGEARCSEKIAFPKALSVVESVNDSFILRPGVLIHSEKIIITPKNN